jgi:3-deoxy-D-manno-octulosonate 8-phosphate phosphatase (KDO 8-P phosphatase)
MPDKQKINLSKIKMLVVDVDGVLTDGGVIINADGTESKKFSLLDGHGIKMWHRAGFKVAIISGRASEATTVRAKQLEIEYVMQGCKNKLPAFELLLEETKLSAEEIAYIGDDLLDIPLVTRAGLGVAVANAVAELKQKADLTTTAPGGSGAVREVVEYILKNTQKWQNLMERYLI